MPRFATAPLALLDRFGAVTVGPERVGLDGKDVDWDRVVEVRTAPAWTCLSAEALEVNLAQYVVALPRCPAARGCWARSASSCSLYLAVLPPDADGEDVLADAHALVGASGGSDVADADAPPDRMFDRVVTEVVYRRRFGTGEAQASTTSVLLQLALRGVTDTIVRTAAERGVDVVHVKAEETSIGSVGRVRRRGAARRSTCASGWAGASGADGYRSSASRTGVSPAVKRMKRPTVDGVRSAWATTIATSARETREAAPSGTSSAPSRPSAVADDADRPGRVVVGERARAEDGPVEVGGAQVVVGGELRVGVGEEARVRVDAVVGHRPDPRHHDVARHPGRGGGVHGAAGGVAVDGVRPFRAPAAGTCRPYDGVEPVERGGDLLGRGVLDVEQERLAAQPADERELFLGAHDPVTVASWSTRIGTSSRPTLPWAPTRAIFMRRTPVCGG